MTREITIVTPENVTITYEVGGFGSRAVAYLLDSLIQYGVMLVVFLAGLLAVPGMAELISGERGLTPIIDVWVALVVLAVFLIMVGYYIFFETRWNGQTPGKRAMGLRVVKEEGAPIDFSSAVIRNLIRFVELSALPVIGILCVLLSPSYRRIGDYAAGTIVVKERTPSAAVPEGKRVRLSPKAAPEAEYVRDVDLLTKDELAAVRRFVERRWQLDRQVQESVARQIAVPIMSRLGMPEPAGRFSYANFLEEMFRKCVEERGAT